MKTRLEMMPRDLYTAIESRRCVLFVGSSLSRAAGLLDLRGTLKSLLKRWCRTHGAPQEFLVTYRESWKWNDLQVWNRSVQRLRELLGPRVLEREIADAIRCCVHETTALHREIPKTPFCGVITTNCDTLLERGFSNAPSKRCLTTFTCNDALDLDYALGDNRFFLLKAHGDIEKPSTLLLNDRDFGSLRHKKRGYIETVSAIFATRTVLFLGVSLDDPEIQLFLDQFGRAFRDSRFGHYALIDSNDCFTAVGQRWRNDYCVDCMPYESDTEASDTLGFLSLLPRVTSPAHSRS